MTKSHYDIFVSYAKEDSAFARQLVEALRARKISVWYDRGELRFGDSILREVEDGLEHSDCFVLLLSPESVKKPWTQFETGVALGRGGKGRIFPIFLKHFDPMELTHLAPSVRSVAGLDAEKLSVEEIADAISESIKRREERNGDSRELSP
jgi:predicted nucleotide-binding protein